MSRVEVDVLRSALVLTSAGLDAAMKRLVNDAGRALLGRQDSGARRQFEEYLKNELAKPQVSDTFRSASEGSSDVVIGLIDGRVDLDHPDLVDSDIRHLRAPREPGQGSSADSASGHGTFVAGLTG